MMCLSFFFVLILTTTIQAERCGENCECGKSKNVEYYESFNENRILGGKDSDPQDWPFIVRLSTHCTGSIINNQWILSAAHCEPSVDDGDDLNVTVQINGVWHGTQKYIIHEEFNADDFSNDIMLLQLKDSIEFSENVSSVCIRANLTVPPMEIGAAAGFGITFVRVETLNDTYQQEGLNSNETIFDDNDILRETPVIIRDLRYCNITIDYSNETPESLETKVCAGGANHGTTQGDSGGPLMVIREHRWIQYGITSVGTYTPVPGDLLAVADHGIYTKVSAYCDWIAEKTGQEVTCQ